MSGQFRQIRVELERLGYVYKSRNTRGGESWAHPCGHTVTLSPGVSEDQRRWILRTCQKALGIKGAVNKRNTSRIKDRQAAARQADRAVNEARAAWLEARIRDLETAATLRALTTRQQHDLRERLAELADLRQLMAEVPHG